MPAPEDVIHEAGLPQLRWPMESEHSWPAEVLANPAEIDETNLDQPIHSETHTHMIHKWLSLEATEFGGGLLHSKP